MQSQTHTFIINGSPMPCLQAGSGEPLLLIHGALANYTLWLEHIEQLSQHYTVYAPTLRHFGEAGKEGPFGLETHAGDLLALLACGPVHLVAWSYGSDVALTAALQAPARVRSLYLVEPGCPGALDEQGLAAFMADAGAMFGQVEAGQLQEAVATLIDGSGAAQATLPLNPSSGNRPNWRRPPACPSN
ncbi:alpha/beta fold hydrolase [Aeromonas hydrophila]|uniref:alpha/beta fold hydrolase n=1 Tax=Aeromonas hydrophila TaxID=644 RepID=UPI003EC84C4D